MYPSDVRPAHFQNDDPAELRRLMRAHHFAKPVTVGPEGVPFASHLPMLVEEDEGASALRLRDESSNF